MSDFSNSTVGQDLAKIGKGLSKASSAADQGPKKPYSDEATSYHTGGTIPADGVYKLQAGEHVLTAPEAEKAKKHALMASGMKSLAKPVKSAKAVRKGK